MLRSYCVVGSAMGYGANPAPCVQWCALGFLPILCEVSCACALGAAKLGLRASRVSRVCARACLRAFVLLSGITTRKSMLARAFALLSGIATLAAVCAGSSQGSCLPRLGLLPIASRLAGSLGSAAKESSVLAVHACLFRRTLATCSAYVRQVLL